MFRPRAIVVLVLGACAPAALACSGAGDRAAKDPGWVECVVPRPEICTEEWRPVCGLRDTGIRCVTEPCDSWETKTFSNACTACADEGVYGWRPDACEHEGIVRPEGPEGPPGGPRSSASWPGTSTGSS